MASVAGPNGSTRTSTTTLYAEVMRAHGREISIVALDWTSSDELLTGGMDGKAKAWRVQRGREEEIKKGDDDYDEDGKRGTKQYRKIPPKLTCKRLDTFLSLGIISLKAKGDRFATTSLDGTVRICDSTSGKVTQYIDAGSAENWKIAFSSDGKTIICGTRKGALNFWDCDTGKKVKTISCKEGAFTMNVACSTCGRWIASTHDDGTLCILSTSTDKVVHEISAHKKTIRAVDFTVDSKRVLTGADDNSVHIFDVLTGKCLKQISCHSSWIYGIAAHPKCPDIFATASADQTVKEWDVSSEKALKTLVRNQRLRDVSYDPKGEFLAAVGDLSTLSVYKL